MSQHRRHSLAEALTNNAVGFGIAFGINCYLLPSVREWNPASAAGYVTGIFTVVSIIRSYVLRRIFNRWHK